MESSAGLVQAVRRLVDRPGDLKDGEADDLRLMVDLIHARLGLQLAGIEGRKHPLVPPLQFPGSKPSQKLAPQGSGLGEGPEQNGGLDLATEFGSLRQMVQDLTERLEAVEERAEEGKSFQAVQQEASTADVEHSSGSKDSDAEGRKVPTIEDLGEGQAAQEFLFGEVLNLIARMDKVRERDDFYRRQQKNTDKAQDELLTMELDKIRREVHSRASREDLTALEEACEASVKAAQTSVKSFLRGQTQAQDTYLQETLDKVLRQLGVVQAAQENTTQALDARQEKVKTILMRQSEQTKQMQNDVFRTTNELNTILDKLLDNDKEHKSMGEALRTHDDRFDVLEASTKKLEDQIQGLGEKLAAIREEAEEGRRAVEKQLGLRLDKVVESTQNLVRNERRAVEAAVEQQVSRIKTECDAALSTTVSAVKDELSKDLNAVRGAVADVRAELENTEPLSPASPDFKSAFSTVASASLESQEKLEEDMRRVLKLLFGEVDTGVEEGGGGDVSKQGGAEEEQFVPPWTREISEAMTRVELQARVTNEAATQLAAHVGDLDARQKSSQESQEKHDKRIFLVEGNTAELNKITDGLGGRIDALGVALRTEVKSALSQFLSGSIADEVRSGKAGFNSLVRALKQSELERQDDIQRLQTSAVANTMLLRQVEGQTRALLTKEEEWRKTEAQIAAHANIFANHCIVVEQLAERTRNSDLASEEQQFISSNVQLVAERIADHADYSVILGMVNAESVDGVDWDDIVEMHRKSLLDAFLNTITITASKTHPSFDPVIEQTRQAFLTKVSMALQVALSKFRRVNIGSTIFGKQKLVPACIACNRPLDAASALGESPAAKRPALTSTLSPVRTKKGLTHQQQQSHHHSTPPPRMHTSSSISSIDEFVPLAKGGGKFAAAPQSLAPVKSSPVTIPTAANAGNSSKDMFRGGFRFASRLPNDSGGPESSDESFVHDGGSEQHSAVARGMERGRGSDTEHLLQLGSAKRAAAPASISLGESIVIPTEAASVKNKSADARSKRSETSASTAVRKAAGQIKWGST